jgi:hypothetical protein
MWFVSLKVVENLTYMKVEFVLWVGERGSDCKEDVKCNT